MHPTFEEKVNQLFLVVIEQIRSHSTGPVNNPDTHLNQQSMGSLLATFSTMSVSIGIVMQNATTNQHNGQNIATASLAKCCQLIITLGAQAA